MILSNLINCFMTLKASIPALNYYLKLIINRFKDEEQLGKAYTYQKKGKKKVRKKQM